MANSKFTSSSPDAQATSVGSSGGIYDTAGAITEKGGTVLIGGSGVTALTLAAPTSGADDGKELTIIAQTTHAHTVTTPAAKINGAHSVLTFAAIGDGVKLVAYGGVWYTVGLALASGSGVTSAGTPVLSGS